MATEGGGLIGTTSPGTVGVGAGTGTSTSGGARCNNDGPGSDGTPELRKQEDQGMDDVSRLGKRDTDGWETEATARTPPGKCRKYCAGKAKPSKEAPSAKENLSRVVVGFVASDKKGEIHCNKSHENDLGDLASAYEEQQKIGRHFVHVRKKHSSNRGLRALQQLTGTEQF